MSARTASMILRTASRQSASLSNSRTSPRYFANAGRTTALCTHSYSTSKNPASSLASSDPPVTLPSRSDDPYPLPLQHTSHPPSNPDANPDATVGQADDYKPDPTSTTEPFSGNPLIHIKSLSEVFGEHPEGREEESLETMRSRLVYMSRKRGVLETDLLLGTFVEGRLRDWDKDECREYDLLLTLPDWTIYYWAINRQQPPQDSFWTRSKILADLREHAKNKGREVRMMPELDRVSPRSS